MRTKQVQKRMQDYLFRVCVLGTLGGLSILLFFLTKDPAFKLFSFVYPIGAGYYLIRYWIINRKNPEKETCTNFKTDL